MNYSELDAALAKFVDAARSTDITRMLAEGETIMKDDQKILLLLGFGALATWLWLTRSGQAVAQAAGTAIGQTVFNVMQTRGERNHNPGNIRISNAAWIGKIPLDQNTDGSFEQFADPVYGIRALARNLLTYYRTHGLDTVQKIIARWAPGHENPTDAYVASVAREIGATPTEKINLLNPITLTAFTRAVIRFENGRVIYPDSVLVKGVHKALA